MVMQIIRYFIAIATIVTGLFSLIAPLKVRGFTGLEVSGGRGITEIRSILGGLFIGLGAAALWFNDPKTYAMLGISYLAIGAVRLVSMFLDKSLVSSNYISLAVEIIFGILLFL